MNGIEWTHNTFNPWIGCQRVGTGYDHCYAEAMMDTRLGRVEQGPHGSRRRTGPAYWQQPIEWNRQAEYAGERRRVFCASLADVFDTPLPTPPVIILVERNPRAQARSQVKLALDLARPDRHIEKAMERGIRRDMPLARARMKSTGPTYRFSFEDVLAAPLAAASKLGGIVAEHFDALFDAGDPPA